MEIIFTGLHSAKNKEFSLIGNTSIWMFPIYGLACCLSPICKFLRHKNIWIRGGVYTCFIFFGEYCTGSFLKKHQICPWDYSKAKYNLHGLVRLDYAPYWFGAGLLFERLLK